MNLERLYLHCPTEYIESNVIPVWIFVLKKLAASTFCHWKPRAAYNKSDCAETAALEKTHVSTPIDRPSWAKPSNCLCQDPRLSVKPSGTLQANIHQLNTPTDRSKLHGEQKNHPPDSSKDF